ncbi:MAG: flagellar hook assembly protein FlgD [Woeseiaceae bacterium]
MNQLDSLSQIQNLGLTTAATGADQQSVGQTEFLQLMLAQFENQDPFEPMENGEFLSQLAQFSTASGIEELQTAFSDFASTIYSDQALQASSLVGSEVLVGSELVQLNNDSGLIQGAVEVEQGSGDVTIDVLDASGQLVQTIALGNQPSGLAAFEWDGVLANGEVAVPGIYQFSARIERRGEAENVPTLIRTAVDSVTLGANGGGVTINSDLVGAFSLGLVRQIF